jgi:soluble lytic murein transglycosylase-like protein
MKNFVLLLLFSFFLSYAYADIVDISIIARIESSNNPLVYNQRTKATGLYGITPICLKEFNQYNHKSYTLASLFNPIRNYEVAYWYLNIRIPQMLKYYNKKIMIENILICYDAGIKYVVKDLPLKKETINYIEKYKRENKK